MEKLRRDDGAEWTVASSAEFPYPTSRSPSGTARLFDIYGMLVSLGSLSPRRDMTFVEDTARAFVLAARAEGIEGETIHFGTGMAHSIGEIAEMCLAAAGSKASLSTDEARVRPEKSEVECLQCDPAKAERLLSWRPETGLEQGIAAAAEHIRSAPDQYDAGVYSV